MSNIGIYPNSSIIPGDVEQLTASLGGAATPTASGNINILGGTGISTVTTPNTITINATGSTGITWELVTDATKTLEVGHGYIPNRLGTVTFTLPATSSVGDTIRIAGNLASSNPANYWQVNQGAGQYISGGDRITTVGATGYVRGLAGISPKQCIEIVCTEADLGWLIVSQIHGDIDLL